jgi:hypothetical protein
VHIGDLPRCHRPRNFIRSSWVFSQSARQRGSNQEAEEHREGRPDRKDLDDGNDQHDFCSALNLIADKLHLAAGAMHDLRRMALSVSARLSAQPFDRKHLRLISLRQRFDPDHCVRPAKIRRPGLLTGPLTSEHSMQSLYMIRP